MHLSSTRTSAIHNGKTGNGKTNGVTHWLGVVSHNHVLRGVEGGFAQVCHGKRAPLAQMKQGDGLVYYSPSTALGQRAKLRSFTAIGTVLDDNVYSFQMAPGFTPYRRNMTYHFGTHIVAIADLKAALEFTQKTNWGFALRRGLIRLSANDYGLIARAMGVTPQESQALNSHEK